MFYLMHFLFLQIFSEHIFSMYLENNILICSKNNLIFLIGDFIYLRSQSLNILININRILSITNKVIFFVQKQVSLFLLHAVDMQYLYVEYLSLTLCYLSLLFHFFNYTFFWQIEFHFQFQHLFLVKKKNIFDNLKNIFYI